jgi:hypothetical protein
MKVLVCGGRDYFNSKRLESVLDTIDAEKAITAIVHGAYRGADLLAQAWALKREVVYIGVPAKWRRMGPRAGPERNQRMLDDWGPFDLVVAFPGGDGTADMVRRASAAGVQVRLSE